MAPFHLAVHLETTRRDAAVGDAEIAQMPSEVCAELIAVVGLHSLDGREPLPHLIEKGDDVRNRTVSVDPQDAIARGLVHRGELIQAAASEFAVFDVDLDGLPGHSELPAPPGPGAIALHRDPRHPVPLEDLVDRGHGDIDLVEALKVEADADRTVLALGADARDQGDDVRERAARWGFRDPDLRFLSPSRPCSRYRLSHV